VAGISPQKQYHRLTPVNATMEVRMAELNPNDRQPYQMQYPEYFNYISEVDVERKTLEESVYMHWHEFCELEFVVSGNGVHNFNAQQLPYEAGVLFLQLPTDFHEVLIDEDDKPFVYNIKFSEAYIENSIYQTLYGKAVPRQVLLKGDEYRQVLSDLEEMYSEYHSEEIFREHILKGILEKLIVKLERKVMQESEAASGDKSNRNSPNIIMRSLTYIQQNYNKPITLTMLAQQVNVSSNYFSTVFRESVGCTFRDYLLNVRMRYAISFLTNLERPIYEISERAGFNSYTHFERTFRKKFGMSPKMFRETLREKQKDSSVKIRTVEPDDQQVKLHRRLNRLIR